MLNLASTAQEFVLTDSIVGDKNGTVDDDKENRP